MGTFITILVGMVTVCGLNAGGALFFSGLFNLISGFIFGIPIAVQSMKAIGIIAINEGLTVTNQSIISFGKYIRIYEKHIR